MTTPTTFRRNRGLLRAYTMDVADNTGSSLRPGDPAYSPTDAVTQNPEQYGVRNEDPTQQRGPGLSPGWWPSPGHQINPSQYIDQNVGGVSGDTKRLGWSKG